MVAVRSRVDRLVSPTLSRHLLIALGAAVVLLLLSAQIGAYDDYNLTAVAIFAVAAAGLTLLTGLNGQLSLGHGALMAVGAYTASLLLKDHRQFPVIVVLLLAVLSTGLIGIVFGYAAARLRGPYLAGATLTLAVALPQVATRYKSIFGGDSGLTVPPSAPPDWLGADFPAERWLAWIALAAALVTMLLLANLLRTAPGRAFKAVRDNEAAAALAGIDVARTQVLAFVISAACAGLAGALFAYWSGITSPAGFSLSLSLQLITAIVIGGLGSLAGAVWGSVVLVYVPLLTSGMATSTLKLPSAVADNLPLAIYGGILVIAMLVAPHGIQGALGRILALGRARWGHTPGGGQKGVVDWDDPAPDT
jgi:branched-chain amino acid transport system permease protein